jgi:serine/threonine protein kinase
MVNENCNSVVLTSGNNGTHGRKKRMMEEMEISNDGESERRNVMFKMNMTTNHKPELSDFEILSSIASGSYGEVKLCYYKPMMIYCCCKILRKQDVYRRKQIDHVFNEKMILKHLNNRHIVKLYETFNDENNLYMFMEYIPGGELFYVY